MSFIQSQHTPKSRVLLKDFLSQKCLAKPNPKKNLRFQINSPSVNQTKETLESQIYQLTQQNILQQKRIEDLSQELATKDKQLERLKCINQYLLQQNEYKGNLISVERGQLKELKTLIAGNSQKRPDTKIQPEQIIQQSPPVMRRRSTYIDFNSAYTNINAIQQFQLQDDTIQNDMRKNIIQIYEIIGTLQDQFKLSNVLDLKISDQEAKLSYAQDPSTKFLGNLLSDEDKFITQIQGITDKKPNNNGQWKMSFIYEKLRRLALEHKQFFETILRLKQLIAAAIEMTQSQSVDESLENIIQQSISCLACDRASCFILDEDKGELWSRVAKGVTGIIRFPSNLGIAGFVAQNKKLQNVHKASTDPRFNKEFDLRNNYKTETILASPILKKKQQCLGVIQCVNKLEGFFQKDDEFIISVLAEFARVVLSRSFSEDERVVTNSKLRLALKVSMKINDLYGQPMDTVLLTSEKLLMQLMNVQYVRVVFYNKDKNKIIYYSENGVLQEVNGLQGLIGECLRQQSIILTNNGYEHQQYSPLLDIRTSLPVVCLPIMNKGRAQGVLMLPNIRGVQNLLANTEARLQQVDEEVLQAFSQQLATCIRLSNFDL